MKIIRGTVIHGDKVGRKLGYRTANLSRRALVGKKIGNGVYAAQVTLRGTEYRALVVIGVASVHGSGGGKVEVYILNFRGNLYGKKLEVGVLKKIRSLVEFKSIEQMRRQVRFDIAAIKKMAW